MVVPILDNFKVYVEILKRDSIIVELEENQVNEFIPEKKLLIIPPYNFKYKSHCKLRWRDRSLKDLFCNEFKSRPICEYQRLVNEKKLLVNNLPVNSLDYLLKNGDFITHSSIFIELPVSSEKIVILYDTPLFLVVYKPHGIPCYPQGRFNKLSLTKIIESEYLLQNKTIEENCYIHPINRLDRCTSGLVLLSKNAESTKELTSEIKNAQKFYLAKIKGNSEDFISSIKRKNLNGVKITKLSSKNSYGIATHLIRCEVGLRVIKNQGDNLTTCIDSSINGKNSLTYFFVLTCPKDYQPLKTKKLLAYSNKYFVLLCKPITGRTHQIRAHLSYMGFPIFRDLIYSNTSSPNLKSGNARSSLNLNFSLSTIGIDKIHEFSVEKYFGGGGIMTVDFSSNLASVEYFIEPPIGICLHSLLYILNLKFFKRPVVLKCSVLPKWLFEDTNIDIEVILNNWPIWNNSDSESFLYLSQNLF